MTRTVSPSGEQGQTPASARGSVILLGKRIESEAITQKEIIGYGAIRAVAQKLASRMQSYDSLEEMLGFNRETDVTGLREITTRMAMLLSTRDGEAKVSVISDFILASNFDIHQSLFMIRGLSSISESANGAENLIGVVNFLSKPRFDETMHRSNPLGVETQLGYAFLIFDLGKYEDMSRILRKAKGNDEPRAVAYSVRANRTGRIANDMESMVPRVENYVDPFAHISGLGPKKKNRIFERTVYELPDLSRPLRRELVRLIDAIGEDNPAATIARLGDRLSPVRTDWRTAEQRSLGDALVRREY